MDDARRESPFEAALITVAGSAALLRQENHDQLNPPPAKPEAYRLAYLFEKTRGIQVFRVNGLSQSTQLAFILQRLKKRKDVLSAETSL